MHDRHPTLHDMFRVSLDAFWTLAARLELSVTEQAALLAVSRNTCRRWRRTPPKVHGVALDRLQIILLAYGRLSELAPVEDREKARIFRAPGSAGDPNDPALSLRDALSVTSVPVMLTSYHRFASRVHAS